jgi:predicted unusual protein kinase regulating ubiquinone biosynthesis (AarF/ABC1/UbiB family)
MMDYIEGKQLNQLNISNFILKEMYSKMILKANILSVLSGNLHGDLHPGNLLFIEGENPKICLLDFGIVLKIEKNIIKLLMNIINDLYEKNAVELSIYLLDIIIHNFHKLHYPSMKKHLNNLLNKVSEIIKNVQTQHKQYNIINYFQCIELVMKYINEHELNKYDIYLNNDFYKINVSFFMASSIISKLCDKELFLLINDVCKELFHTDLI